MTIHHFIMTIKEITALRKSGRIDEALECAEREFAANANKFTASALFWCLNEFLKRQEGPEFETTESRMHSLYRDYCEGDEYMQKSLASAARRQSAHFNVVKEALEQTKSGIRVTDNFNAIARLHDCGQFEAFLYQDFGWVIYYALRHTPVTQAHLRKTMIARYLKLNLPVPSMLHSLILGEAIKIEQNTPLEFRIRDFIRLWGLENLREEDWEEFRTDDGHTLPSTVEKLIGVYAKELKTDGVEAPEEFDRIVDMALMKFPSSQNMPYFKATVLLSQGKRDEAMGYYRDLLLRFPSKHYLWHHTAALVDDADTKIGLLAKALTIGVDEQFLGKIRLSLAGLLIEKGLYAEAGHELDRYRDLYQSKGWNLKGDYWILRNQVKDVSSLSDNKKLYARSIKVADEFVYAGLPGKVAVKVAEKQLEDKGHPGRKMLLWILRTQDGVLRLRKPNKFGLSRRMKDGEIFNVKLSGGKIVWIRPLDIPHGEDWIKELDGEVKLRTDRNGKRYCKIGGVYVGEKLLSGISEGQRVKLRALRQEDGRWSAVRLTPSS